MALIAADPIEAGDRDLVSFYDLIGESGSGADLFRADARLRAGISLFELAKVMGTSVAMIERHYGSLLDGANAGIASRLASFEAEQEHAARAERSDRLGH
ncbi:MAG: hypothetical protein ACXVH3_36865 [Solirubrobacteraceae bacterium]